MGFADEFAPASQIKKLPFSEGIKATKAGLLTFSIVPNVKKDEAKVGEIKVQALEGMRPPTFKMPDDILPN